MAKCPECLRELPHSRSIQQNRFRFVVLNFLWEHDGSKDFKNFDLYHDFIKGSIHWVEPVFNRDGSVQSYKPKSTAFDKMPQKEFNKYFNALQNWIFDELVPQYGDGFEEEVTNLLRIFR